MSNSIVGGSDESVPHLTSRKCETGVTVIEVGGRQALRPGSGQVEAVVLKALNEGERRIVFDLSRISRIDSTGIGIITYCFNKISQRRGRCAVAGVNGMMLEVFRIACLDTIVPLYSDLASACGELEASAAA